MDLDSVEEFRSLASLFIESKKSIAQLASAIEANGVYGADRYGRFMKFDRDSPEAQLALDALAAEWAADDSDDFNRPIYAAEPGDAYLRFGWPVASLPSFDQVTHRISHQPLTAQQIKGINSNLRIIGAMLRYVRGDYTPEGESLKIDSPTALARLLALKAGGDDQHGLSFSNLKTQFARAEQLLNSSDEAK